MFAMKKLLSLTPVGVRLKAISSIGILTFILVNNQPLGIVYLFSTPTNKGDYLILVLKNFLDRC